MNPIISIITPFFNAGQYIEETAQSVLSQTFKNFEWIIVDDGSSDEEVEILKQIEKMDSRIKVLTQKGQSPIGCAQKETSQMGPAQTRDFGIRNSNKNAKYIVFLDADDLYEKTFLECCYWTLETHPEASWAYTDSVNFGERNFLWRKWYNPKWEMDENILIVSACVRKKDLLEVGGFGLKKKKVYEDWYLWLKLIKAGKYPIRMNSLLTYYRQKKNASELQDSNSQNKKNALKIIEDAKKDIVIFEDGIQYPKFDYNWEEIVDEIDVVKTKQTVQDKINILMIIPWMVTGGADRFNLDLVSRMNKIKFNFTIITTLPASNEWRKYFEKYATIYDLTTFLDMKYWISFINYIIKRNHINLIFNSNSQFGYKILPYLKAKYPEIPIVDFVHMEEWYWRNGGYSRDSSVNQSILEKTFTCNENSRKVFINRFGRKEDEIETIYIGVDEEKFNPEKFNKTLILEEIIGKQTSKNIISYICRISEQKRPFLFFEVIKKLAEKRKDFIVIVAGDGPMLNDFKRKVNNAKLNYIFIFVGNFKETEKIYKISDVTVNTSIKEGLALTSYESLSMGVPVVSSDVGGQSELIKHNVGIIVPCIQREEEILNFDYSDQEIDNYVLAINEILENKDFYKQNCRERILKDFTTDKMIKTMERELENIAKNPNEKKKGKGIELSKNIDVLKELISTYFASSKQEYEWLVEDFNNKNIHKKEFNNKKQFYEHTLEYKIKHPIVVTLRKIGIYDRTKRLLGRVGLQ